MNDDWMAAKKRKSRKKKKIRRSIRLTRQLMTPGAANGRVFEPFALFLRLNGFF